MTHALLVPVGEVHGRTGSVSVPHGQSRSRKNCVTFIYVNYLSAMILYAVPRPTWTEQLPLSRDLYLTSMTRNCPLCGIPLTKSGSWFQVSGGYTCGGCKQRLPMTYDDKLSLFEKYAPTSGSSARP